MQKSDFQNPPTYQSPMPLFLFASCQSKIYHSNKTENQLYKYKNSKFKDENLYQLEYSQRNNALLFWQDGDLVYSVNHKEGM